MMMTQVISGQEEGPTAVTKRSCRARAAAAAGARLLENKSHVQEPINPYLAVHVRYGGWPWVANSICTLSVGSLESFHLQQCPGTASGRVLMLSPFHHSCTTKQVTWVLLISRMPRQHTWKLSPSFVGTEVRRTGWRNNVGINFSCFRKDQGHRGQHQRPFLRVARDGFELLFAHRSCFKTRTPTYEWAAGATDHEHTSNGQP